MNEAWSINIQGKIDKLKEFTAVGMPPPIMFEDLVERIGELSDDIPPELIEARVTKSLMLFLKGKLDRNLRYNQRFRDKTEWKWLNQLLAAARLKELARVKIVRKGRKGGMGFDITELVESYYGKQILKSIQFNVTRRRMANREEFHSIQEACAKIKLKLPEAIQPTTTEEFFARDEGE